MSNISMKKHCFSHLKGFTEELEKQMYNQEIYYYEDLLKYLTTSNAYFRFKKQNIVKVCNT